jgi:pyridoxine 5-phosphate synthase
MKTLNINIDHIATLREARKGTEPEPLLAAQMAVLAGADGIVAHLREDRRHINDRDVKLIRELVDTRFDLEMAANDEIIKIALEIIPDLVTIVPEKRNELTTEGGLDVASYITRFEKLTESMHEKNILVSYFIEPEIKQIDAVKQVGADIIELHTGTYANLYNSNRMIHEFERLKNAADYGASIGLHIAAGHGLNYNNTKKMLEIDSISEYSVGHSVISRAAFTGLERAVRDMIEIIKSYKR